MEKWYAAVVRQFLSIYACIPSKIFVEKSFLRLYLFEQCEIIITQTQMRCRWCMCCGVVYISPNRSEAELRRCRRTLHIYL